VKEAKDRNAEIINDAEQGDVRDNLIGQGGPAVDLLVKLMGVEKQKEYVYTVMFGL
jgi:hypothetical protein